MMALARARGLQLRTGHAYSKFLHFEIKSHGDTKSQSPSAVLSPALRLEGGCLRRSIIGNMFLIVFVIWRFTQRTGVDIQPVQKIAPLACAYDSLSLGMGV